MTDNSLRHIVLFSFMLACLCLASRSYVLGETVNPVTGIAADYPVGFEPLSIVSADFNGDGKHDLAVANRGGDSVSILLGDGIGGFAAAKNFPAGIEPYFITAGDFNNDLKSDLVVTNDIGSTISVLLGDGAGNFGARSSFGVGELPVSVAVGDFNNDGKSDLAVGSSGFNQGGVSILLGLGNGSFNTATKLMAGTRSGSVAIGDFNNDGKRDLAVSNVVGVSFNNVSILLGDGAGNFSAPVNMSVGASPGFILVNDFNKDGKSDLAVASGEASALSIFLGDGTGGFGTATNFNALGGPLTLALGDFNSDGKDDLAVGGSSTSNVTVLLGDNTGQFSAPTQFSTGTTGAFRITAKDFNSDGVSDLAAANAGSNKVSIILSPFPTASIGDVTVMEGQSGETSANFVVTLSIASSQQITLIYTLTNGTATFGSDFSSSSTVGILTIPPGQTTATINIPVNGDNTFETDETFFVTLRDPVNAFISGAQGKGTILNDDSPPTITINDVSRNEGDTGTRNVTFTVALSNASYQTITVNYMTSDGTAIAGNDYVAKSGTLTFNAGEVSKSIVVQITGDTANEADETFLVNLTNASNATIVDGQGIGTIVNDDDPARPILQLNQSRYNIAEGTGSLDLLVNRSGDTSLPVTVNYATTDAANFLQNCNVINTAATSRCDYVGVLGTLHFASGETSKTISISVVDDTYLEGPEALFISLSNATGGAAIGANQRATITITDNSNDVSGQPNPIDDKSFFVRQHYIDFLSREPDPLSAGWVTILNQCAAGDQSCRLTVSQGIYGSPEFRDRGYFIYKFYSVALGRKPSYDEFNLDRARVSGFQTDAELEQSKVDFISDFMSRSEFANIYNGLSNNGYVQRLYDTAGVSQITVNALVLNVSAMQGTMSAGKTRAQVLRDVAESPEVSSRFQTESTVVMHYFGYLRRDPDGAYQQWINTLNSTGDSRNVTSGFINSAEYRARFGQ